MPTGFFDRETVRAYADREAVYATSAEYRGTLPTGLRWVRFEPWLEVSEGTSLAGRWSPIEALRMLSVASTVEDLGEGESVGVETERYAAQIDLRDYAAALAGEGRSRAATRFRGLAAVAPTPIRVEAWVDSGGRVRRLQLLTKLPPTEPGRPTAVLDSRTDLFAFGPVAAPAPPRAADTLDVSPYFRWQLHLLHGQSAPRPAGPPLGAAAFHRRASAICDRGGAAGHRLQRRLDAAADGLRRLSGSGALGGAAGEGRAMAAFRKLMSAFFSPFMSLGRRALGELGALAPPVDERKAWRRYVRLFAESVEDVAAELRAGQIGAGPMAARIGKAAEELEAPSNAIARRLGLPACVNKPQREPSESEPRRPEPPSPN